MLKVGSPRPNSPREILSASEGSWPGWGGVWAWGKRHYRGEVGNVLLNALNTKIRPEGQEAGENYGRPWGFLTSAFHLGSASINKQLPPPDTHIYTQTHTKQCLLPTGSGGKHRVHLTVASLLGNKPWLLDVQCPKTELSFYIF